MKRLLLILTAICLSIALVACGGTTSEPEMESGATPPSGESAAVGDDTQQQDAADDAEQSATLYTILNNLEPAVEHEFTYTGELTAEVLAKGLSDLTGHSFAITATELGEGKIAIDWAADSSLIAGIGDVEQKEEFFVFDVTSLNWFMMDSLNATIINNLGVSEVYYTMEGGQELVLEDMGLSLNPLPFTTDTPYMGSGFYAHHDGLEGSGPTIADISITEGTWRMFGEEGTAYFVMDGAGNFSTYYASGSQESYGLIELSDTTTDDGEPIFVMYDPEGNHISDLSFSGSDMFYLGDIADDRYFIKAVA